MSREAGAIQIASRLPQESSDDCRKRASTAYEAAQKKYDSGRFTYLAFLNTGLHMACVIEMNENLYHKLVLIDDESIINGRIGIAWTKELIKLTNTIPPDPDGAQPDMCTWWIPFQPADEQSINDFKDFLAEIREEEFKDY